jgi:hypothetical protein
MGYSNYETALALFSTVIRLKTCLDAQPRPPSHHCRLRHEAFLTPAVNPWPDSELSTLQNGKTKYENTALHGGDCARRAHNQPKY